MHAMRNFSQNVYYGLIEFGHGCHDFNVKKKKTTKVMHGSNDFSCSYLTLNPCTTSVVVHTYQIFVLIQWLCIIWQVKISNNLF